MKDVMVSPQFKPETLNADVASSRTGAAASSNNTERSQGFAKIFSHTLDQKQRSNKSSASQQKATEADRPSTKIDGQSPSSQTRKYAESAAKSTQTGRSADSGKSLPETGNNPAVPADKMSEKTTEQNTTIQSALDSSTSDSVNPASLNHLNDDTLSSSIAYTPTATVDTIPNTAQLLSDTLKSVATVSPIDNDYESTVASSSDVSDVIQATNLDITAQPGIVPINKATDPAAQNAMIDAGPIGDKQAALPPFTLLTTGKMESGALTGVGSGLLKTGASQLVPQSMSVIPAIEEAASDLTGKSNIAINSGAKTTTAVQEAPVPGLLKLVQEQIGKPGQNDITDQRVKLALQENAWKDLVNRTVSEAGAQIRPASLDSKFDTLQDSRQFKNQFMYDKFYSQPGQQEAKSSVMTAAVSALTGSSALASESGLASTDLRLTATEIEGASAIAHPRLATPATGNLMPMLQLTTQFQHPAWSQDMGNKLMFMIRQDLQQAQLQLNPQHLGPVEVRISVGQDQQVNVMFTAQQASVREALDGAMTRLRDMLEQQGFSLNEFNVSDQAQKQHQEQQARREGINKEGISGLVDPEDIQVAELPPENHKVLGGENLVDYFA